MYGIFLGTLQSNDRSNINR